MNENPSSSSTVNRFATILGIVLLTALVGYGVLLFWMIQVKRQAERAPVIWSMESFGFTSGYHCFVFPEPKLAVFLDGEAGEIFDYMGSYGFDAGMTVNRFNGRSSSTHGSTFSYISQDGKTTMEFHDGKCVMIVSERGTKLTLADGREFELDGQIPLWFRCQSDGTITELDELPKGFVDYFESPPPDPGLLHSVKSYPDAFQKK